MAIANAEVGIKIGGIPGDSGSLDFEGAFNLSPYSFGLTDPLSSASTGSSQPDGTGYDMDKTKRIDRLDALGLLIGTSLVSTSDGATWSDDYDLNDQWVASSFRSTDGAWEESRRIDPPDVLHAQAPLSHAIETTGFWPDQGSYQRLAVFDTNNQLVYSSASNADGSTELYTLAETADGYTGTWTWTDTNGELSSWEQEFDAELMPLESADPWQSEQIERTDEQGQLIGTSFLTTNDWATWSDDYDLNDQWVGSSFRSTDGAWEESRRIDPPDVLHAQAPLSYAIETTGFWPDQGSYQHLAVFDTNKQLVYSSASNADGSTELYSLAETADGYTGTWTWTDASGEISSSQEAFNTEMLPLAIQDDRGMAPWMRTMVDSKHNSETAQPFEPQVLTSTNASLRLNRPETEDITHASLTGTGDYNLRGNARDNVLVGNAGNNRINGGRGADALTGGKGSDQFVLRLRRNSVDTITDFNPQDDTLILQGDQLHQLFGEGPTSGAALAKHVRFDDDLDALIVREAPGASESKSWMTLVKLPGLSANQIFDELTALVEFN
jgi:hypothetical protein